MEVKRLLLQMEQIFPLVQLYPLLPPTIARVGGSRYYRHSDGYGCFLKYLWLRKRRCQIKGLLSYSEEITISSCLESDKSSSRPIVLFWRPTEILFSHLLLDLRSSLFPSCFLNNLCMQFSSPQYMPNSRPILWSLSWWQSFFLANLTGCQSRNSPLFTEPEVSIPHSQVPAICPCSEPEQSSPCPHSTSWISTLILSSHLRLGLPSGLFPSGFPTKTLYTPRLSPHKCYMSSPFYSSIWWLYYQITCWRVQIMNYRIIKFSPAFCCFTLFAKMWTYSSSSR